MIEKLVKSFDEVTIDQDQTSIEVDISQVYGFSVYTDVAGAGADGTLRLQATVNEEDWFDIETDVISGVTEVEYNKPDQMYRKVRLFFDFTSGTGTINSWFHLKG